MTREDLKSILKSTQNQNAKDAIELIRSNGTPQALHFILCGRGPFVPGRSDVYYERDPVHPRSQFRMAAVLDAAYDDPTRPYDREERVVDGVTIVTTRIDFRIGIARPQYWANQLELFKTCLDAGCLPGHSNHRPLFTRIVTQAFKYGACFGGSEADIAYAKTVIEKTPFDLPLFALNRYEWLAQPESLDTLLSFGLDPRAPGLIAQVLHYTNCSDSPGSTPNAKWTIINRLLDLGATLSEEEAVSFQRRSHSTADILEQQTLARCGLQHPRAA